MDKKVSKEMIWGFYGVLIIVLSVVGYFIGLKKNKEKLYAIIGMIIGVMISIILWLTVGKKMSSQNGY